MGISDSKILAQKVLNACEAAQRQGKSELDAAAFWRDEVISMAARKVFPHIPKQIRGPKRQNAAERAAILSSSKITIPGVVEEIQAHQKRALEQQGLQGGYMSIIQRGYLQEHASKCCTLAECYMLIVGVEKDVDMSIIRLRLCYVLFYQLKENIQRDRLCHDAVSFMVDVIATSGLITDTRGIIQEKLVAWTDKGKRYSLLARDLGGVGCLLVLPSDIPESVWGKDLPKSEGRRRIAVLDSLRRRGIMDVAKPLNATAQMELDTLWVPIKRSLDIELNRQLSQLCDNGQRHTGENGQHCADEQSDHLGRQSQVSHYAVGRLPSPRIMPCPDVQISQSTRAPNVCPPPSSIDSSSPVQDLTSLMVHQNPDTEGGWNPPSGSNHHDLASFSMLQNSTNPGSFAPVHIDYSHDLASFSQSSDPATNILYPVPGNNFHDLASFSTNPHVAYEEPFISFPNNDYHDIASFSMLPHSVLVDGSSPNTHTELGSLLSQAATGNDASSALNTCLDPISFSTTTHVGGGSSDSLFTSNLLRTDQRTALLASA